MILAASKEMEILKVKGLESSPMLDRLAVEEPLEIRLGIQKEGFFYQKSVSVTMRTPGHDEELALGFLFTEGILSHMGQVKGVEHPKVRRKQARGNIVTIKLAPGLEFDFKRLERHFYTTSSCGVCGKASIDAVEVQCQFDLTEDKPQVAAKLIHELPQKLLKEQSVFDRTGGLHAAALFDASGNLLTVREDVGRHNALDKLLGCYFQKDQIPLRDKLVLVSGRAGFELVQKTIVAGGAILAAVGAPTSLAVELAQENGLTLIGFLRNGQFNIYSNPERIAP